MGTTLAQSFALTNTWGARNVAAGVIDQTGALHTYGDTTHRFRLASVSKLMTAWAALISVEDGSVSLDDTVGQDGCTLRHLLAHAGGYGFDNGAPIISPGRKRVYSNTGFEMLATYVSSKVGMEFDEYVFESVFAPLGMSSSELLGSPAADIHSTLSDLALFAAELRTPKLLARSTYIEASTLQFGELEGVVPGVGRFDPCPWGLGPEIHGAKSPHWMATRNSSSTFGHFGGAGTFVWIDPVANVACFALTDHEFGDWALDAWPQFGDAVLNELGR